MSTHPVCTKKNPLSATLTGELPNINEKFFSSQYNTDSPGLGIAYHPKNQTFTFARFGKGAVYEGMLDIYPISNRATSGMVYQHFQRYLIPYLEPSEALVLFFILDRTLNWSRISARIKKSTFIENEGSNVTNGCGLKSRATVDKALAGLVEKGIIRKPINKTYEIDFKGASEYVISQGGGIKVGFKQIPDKKKKCIDAEHSQIEKCTDLEHHIDRTNPISDSNNLIAGLTASTSVKPSEIYEKSVEIAKNNKSQHLAKLSQKAKNNKSLNPLFAIWNLRCQEVFPEMTPMAFTNKQFGQCGQFLKKVQWQEGQSAEGFFRFVVDKWKAVGLRHFSYVNRGRQERGYAPVEYPEYPDFSFVMAFKNNFVNAYNKDRFDGLHKDAGLIDSLRDAGYTPAEIDSAIQEKRAAERQRKEGVDKIKKREQELEWKAQKLARIEDGLKLRARRMEENYQQKLASLDFKLPNPQSEPVSSTIEPETKPVVPVVAATKPLTEEEMQISAKQIAEEFDLPEDGWVNVLKGIKMGGVEFARNILISAREAQQRMDELRAKGELPSWDNK